MANYDEQVLQSFADHLYSEASWMVFTTALRFGFYTFVGTTMLEMLLARFLKDATAPGVLTFAATLIATLIGIAVGRNKAFDLRLKAQLVLIQMQIERRLRAQQILLQSIVRPESPVR